MTTFDDRVRAYEAEFAHDDEMNFKAKMRRDRFLAVWAAALRGDTMDQAREFAKKLIHEDLKSLGDDQVVELALEYVGGQIDEAMVRAKLDEFMREAKEQIARGV